MYCPNCGTKNEDDSLFCMECGTRLKKDTVLNQLTHQETTPMQPEGRTVTDADIPKNRQSGSQNNENLNNKNQDTRNQNMGNQNENPSDIRRNGNPGGQNDYGQNYGNANPVNLAGRGQPYFTGSAPNSSQPQGGGRYPGTPDQRHHQPPKQKKPVSKLAIFVAIEAIAAVALFAGAYKITSDRFSPEKVAMDYWEAKADRDWSQAYDYCNFPNSDLLTKKMYVQSKADQIEPLEYQSVTIKDVRQLTSEAVNQLGNLASMLDADGDDYDDYLDDLEDELEDDDLKVYRVEYIEKGAASKSVEYITLTETENKKWLFWDEWKVADVESWAGNVTYSIPEGATLQLNGETIDDSAAVIDDGWKIITIPYLFTGDYQLQVTEDGMKPYCKNTSITPYGTEEGNIGLVPTDETLKALGEQAGNDIKFLIESALQGKSFEEVKDVFSSGALEDGYIKNYYENLTNKVKGNGSAKITGLAISNINTALDSSPTGTEIDLRGTAQRKENYINYWNEIEEEDNEIYFVASYCKEGAEWKLMNLPVDEYVF